MVLPSCHIKPAIIVGALQDGAAPRIALTSCHLPLRHWLQDLRGRPRICAIAARYIADSSAVTIE